MLGYSSLFLIDLLCMQLINLFVYLFVCLYMRIIENFFFPQNLDQAQNIET